MPSKRTILRFAGLGLLVLPGLVLILTAGGRGVLQATLGLALLLVLPGYAITAAAFPRMPAWFPDRLLLIASLSLAVGALSGLVLHLTPFGMTPGSWAVLLGSISVAGGVVAVARRASHGGLHWGPWRTDLRRRQAILLILALATTLLAFQVARVGAIDQPQPGFTQLWSLPEQDAAGNHLLRVGVLNMEPARVTYQMRVQVQGKDVYQNNHILLTPESRWETVVTLPANLGSQDPVETLLYRADEPNTAYRQTHVWFTPEEGAGG
jgi:uncharacterized membrane protein